MRTSFAPLRRLGLAALLCAAALTEARSQEPTPAAGAPPAGAPSAAAPQTAPPPNAAAQPSAPPQYADMLYASDAGVMDEYTNQYCGPSCGSCGDASCGYCCPPRFWASVEALGWWQKGQLVQPLVTTSPPGTAQGLAGVLGGPTTTLLGDGTLQYDGTFGGRFTLGHWLDDSEEHALLGRFWALGNSTFDQTFTSDGSNILALPFFNVANAAEDARLVGFPNGTIGTLSGSINVHAISKLHGGDVLLRTPIFRDCIRRWDLVAGYQFSRQEESLDIFSITNVQTVSGGPIDTSVTMLDQFATTNEFHGGVLGLSIQRQVACYSLDILAKVAFGDMRQTTVINGSTQTTSGGATTVDPFGLYAQPTNIGTLVDNKFCVVPELNINFGWYVCPCLKWYVGYSFIYWSSVARPGDQMDRLINTTYQGPLPTGDRRPDHSTVFSHNTWAHGVNTGLEYRF